VMQPVLTYLCHRRLRLADERGQGNGNGRIQSPEPG
jgi:hypothetical protein